MRRRIIRKEEGKAYASGKERERNDFSSNKIPLAHQAESNQPF